MMAMRTEPLAMHHPMPQAEPLPSFPGAQVLPSLRESELRAGMSLGKRGGDGTVTVSGTILCLCQLDGQFGE